MAIGQKQYVDTLGVTNGFTPIQLFRFLQFKNYIGKDEKFEDWEDKLDSLVIKVDTPPSKINL